VGQGSNHTLSKEEKEERNKELKENLENTEIPKVFFTSRVRTSAGCFVDNQLTTAQRNCGLTLTRKK
jgi:hypothetical protein